jgi:hypothetical protein
VPGRRARRSPARRAAQRLRWNGGEARVDPLPVARAHRIRALTTAIVRPFDRSAALVFFGATGLLFILVAETIAASVVLEQQLVDAFYGGVKTLVTVDPNPEVQQGPKWFKVTISLSMLVALLFAAAFTGGLVERLIGRNLTGLVGPRAVPRSDHVIVAGLGQVGLRLCLLLRECGIPVVAIDDRPDGENVGLARRLRLPVVIGRGADPSLLRRLSPEKRDRAGRRRRPTTSTTSGSRSRPGPSAATCGSSCAPAAMPRAGRRARSSGWGRCATCTASAPCSSRASRSAPPPSTSWWTARPRTPARRRRRARALPLPGSRPDRRFWSSKRSLSTSR